jgi:predicted Holliday junction resolvase-like endonuclease
VVSFIDDFSVLCQMVLLSWLMSIYLYTDVHLAAYFKQTYYDIDYKQIQTLETDLQEKLRERERELRKRKEREEHEMERVRIKIRRKEAVTSFQALLVERIKDPTVKSFCSMWLN